MIPYKITQCLETNYLNMLFAECFQLQTDKPGCELNCSCYADGSNEENYIVGRNDVRISYFLYFT